MIERLLGTGGSGEVYEVRDPEHGHPIALKLLPRATITRRPDFVQPFHREYHRLQMLRHPRIVEVYAYGSDAQGLYYTMELMDGPDLRAIRPLPWRQTCILLRDIALSLAIVHSRGLVHRDVGPGNVRLGRDGRAKLLDFGATVSMGIPCDLVGTLPCTPPEAFAYEPLDARADLFGLGALGYYLLTGTHAYPASSVSSLLSLWDGPVAAPSARDPEIPKGLDQLIAALLQRDHRMRPRSATEVINRLEAIADLQPVPAHEAAQTSFVAPALAGRSAEMHLLCCHVAAARGGRGSALLIEGAPGQGRTRLLRQLVVEASHPEVLMLELDTKLGPSQPDDACLELCETLLRQAPDLARHSTVLESLQRGMSAPLPAAMREQLMAALLDALLTLARRTTLVLLVDDVQDRDEATLALIAALAQHAREERLLVVATKQIGAQVHAPFSAQAIARHASRILLEPLGPRAIEALVRSAFVDARQVKFVSDWVTGLSEGNPSKIVELLRHLVEHDLVVFRDGAWVLPEQIDPALLPRDVATALRERIAALSESARELAELLCVLVRPLSLDDARGLVAAEDVTEDPVSAALRVLDELTCADVICVAAGSITIARPSVREIVRENMSPEQLRRAHARVGRALALRFASDKYDARVDLPTAYQWAVAGYHLLSGGELQRGVQLWLNALRYTFEVDYVPIWDGNTWYADCNRLALQAAEVLQLSPSKLARLRIAAVQASLNPEPTLLANGEATLRELEQASGLADYATLTHVSDPATRIQQAMIAAAARWSSTPAAERGIEPGTASALLFGLTLGLSFSYYHTLSAKKVAALPEKLTPFVPLAPGCQAFVRMIEGISAYVAGQTQRELDERLDALSQIESPGMRAFVTDTMRSHLRGLWLYAIAAIETARDPAAGLSRVVQMETETPFMTFGSWQLRLLAHVLEGNAVDAQACAERMEMASVEDNTVAKQVLHASGLQPIAAAYALAEDLVGLQSTIDKLEPFARSVATWRPFHDAARAHYHRLRGQLGLAHSLAERAATATSPGAHRGYGFATIALLRVLLDQHDDATAHSKAGAALELTRQHALGPELEAQLCALDALALARMGELDAAAQRSQEALAIVRASGLSGLLSAEIARALASVAILARQVEAFEQHAATVARLTCAHEHPVLLARYKRLLAEAHDSGLEYGVDRAGAATLQHNTDLRARLLSELDRSSVVRSLPERVLALMIERAGVSAGFLFALEGETLRRTAPEDAEVPAGLIDALHTCLAAERAVAQRATHDTMTATRTSIVRLDDGQLFQVAVLHVLADDGVMRAAGAMALRVRDALPAIPRWDCVLALSTVLAESQGTVPQMAGL